MPTDDQQPPPDPPRPTNMTQEDLNWVVASVLQALERNQPGDPAPPPVNPARSVVTPPAPLRGPTCRLFTPMEEPQVPAGRVPLGAGHQDTSMESVTNQVPRDPLKGKAPMTTGGRGTNKSPFIRRILEEEVPRHFRAPQFSDYTGTTDPEDHVGRFENAASLHQYTDAIRCRVFSTTFSGSALRWFSRLPPASINSFDDFKEMFVRHFSTSRTYCKTTMDLFTTKQRPQESLKDFVRRFNRVAQDVPDATSEVLVGAFSQGLREGDFFRSLIKKPPTNYDALQSRAVKYIHVEEAQSSRSKEKDSPHTYGPSRNPSAVPRAEPRLPPRLKRKPDIDRPAAPGGPSTRAIHVVTNHPGQARRNRRWLPRFCTFHNTQGHDLSECYQYARELRREAEQQVPVTTAPRTQRTPPRQPRRETRPPSPRMSHPRKRSPRRSVPPPRQSGPRNQESPRRRDAPEDNQDKAPVGCIDMIVAGATDGDSHQARKAHSRRLDVCGVSQSPPMDGPVISFGPQDLEGIEAPHDDTLVVRATVANYDIGRVFIDTGSSVNVLFQKTFKQMEIDEDSLEPLLTPLFGFTGNRVQPLRQIILPLSLGAPPLIRTRRILFVVVDASSSYNIILGRPTLSAFSAVASPYHQKIKFPIGDQVGEVRGDQQVSRRCYVDMVRADSRKVQKTAGGEIQII
ncbi:uncharacterized protein LOC141829918 [Curcuma longa]|uniref:uncharacterized protein LOC141829918 n=1 Tax=Curcuma longa TaxID=136217 RepID=UPI003D9DCF8C